MKQHQEFLKTDPICIITQQFLKQQTHFSVIDLVICAKLISYRLGARILRIEKEALIVELKNIVALNNIELCRQMTINF